MRRVVVTGLGILSPLGMDVNQSWTSLLAGHSGIHPISLFDPADLTTRFAGQLPSYQPEQHFDPKSLRRYDRFLQLALVAAQQAVDHAQLLPGAFDPDLAGCYIGSGIGGLEAIEETLDVLREKGPRRVSPFAIPRVLINLAPGTVAIQHGLKGPCQSHVSACASGTHAIGEAFKVIQDGTADVMVAGGAEAPIRPMVLAAFNAMRALSTRNQEPQAACRPFDLDRDGFVLAEGAGILVLEALDHALARGATPLAEVVGYGLSCDAFHITSPAEGGDGAVRSMRMALRHARLSADQVGHINAHGTGTQLNDQGEAQAIRTVFGPRDLPVTSNKSACGHLMGAAGAVEAIATIKSLQEQQIPPTLNYATPDPACPVHVVTDSALSCSFDYALSNSFGFGGLNASLIFRRYTP